MPTARPSYLQLPARELRAWRWRPADAAAITSASGLPLVEEAGTWYLDHTASTTGTPLALPPEGWLVETDGVVLAFDDDAFTRWHQAQHHTSRSAASGTDGAPNDGASLGVHAIDAVALAEGYD